ncbi:hypothetical protein F2Q70_00043454 [Brassica cretica]|uniref:GRF-type domain-containing protein n=2 Tax=Brassica TaxID=3705 RepID=A0A8S9KGD2_BRACR|nr:hypothetical protein F2Q70_00043454 [Brassica cretica]KAF3519148.1 hypothetical protein DY000_02060600 [Brassica cretica]KAG2251481.1 hypothetical protein Bca52824_081617 [Brassica carinata]
MSSDSTSESSTVNTYGIRGFPANCVCGTKRTIYTSETNKNPGRPFVRCLTRRKNHLFKWVEDAVYEEVQDALPKIVLLEAELNKEKSDIADLKGVVTELMEEVVRTKTEVKRCKVMVKILFVIMCLITIVLVVSLM